MGRSSRRVDLPPILRSPLPASVSAVRQEYHEKLKRKWATRWNTSERRQRMAQFDISFPFNLFRKNSYRLSRNQASLMLQLRSGHIPLNKYLSKIGKIETDLCEACLDRENDHQYKEMVNHFIFECSAYEEERNNLRRIIKQRHFNFTDMMASTDNMRHLAEYVKSTGRLKKAQTPQRRPPTPTPAGHR